jgi:hypothetical protein
MIMDSKLGKTLATGCAFAALLALGACGDRGGEDAAEREVRNETASEQARNPGPSDDVAARAAAERMAQGGRS